VTRTQEFEKQTKIKLTSKKNNLERKKDCNYDEERKQNANEREVCD
jgi:hypothetical protein